MPYAHRKKRPDGSLVAAGKSLVNGSKLAPLYSLLQPGSQYKEQTTTVHFELQSRQTRKKPVKKLVGFQPTLKRTGYPAPLYGAPGAHYYHPHLVPAQPAKNRDFMSYKSISVFVSHDYITMCEGHEFYVTVPDSIFPGEKFRISLGENSPPLIVTCPALSFLGECIAVHLSTSCGAGCQKEAGNKFRKYRAAGSTKDTAFTQDTGVNQESEYRIPVRNLRLRRLSM
ncbi:hypothetical protein B484DRAFT_483769 [Ochromonadaceae sp. CCMP2298]|nr:hypothetical protein B484DRAFT_483769 [Ochromonadaceae sp. CCMP2298]